jgi:hypothetical protein
MGEPFVDFLQTAIALVKRCAPFCADAMASALAATRLVVHLEGERCAVLVDGGSVRAHSAPEASLEPGADQAVLSTTSKTLLELVDGAGLLDLVTSNRMRVRATPECAARVFDTLRLFVEGCARSPEIDPVLAAFRAQVESSSSRGALP